MSVAVDVTRRPLSSDELVAFDWKYQRMTDAERRALNVELVGCARDLTDAGMSVLDAADVAFDRIALSVLVS